MGIIDTELATATLFQKNKDMRNKKKIDIQVKIKVTYPSVRFCTITLDFKDSQKQEASL